MIFLDLVDFFGLVWSFDSPKLCIKMFENEFRNELHLLTTCRVRVDYPMSLYMSCGMYLLVS